jgi:hypothetical protein
MDAGIPLDNQLCTLWAEEKPSRLDRTVGPPSFAISSLSVSLFIVAS